MTYDERHVAHPRRYGSGRPGLDRTIDARPNAIRGLLIGLGVSVLFWLLAVVLPLWAHYRWGVGR